MTRLQADALLLLTAIIWGTAFIAQKTALDVMEPIAFVGVRFLLSAAFVAPFALWEWRRIARLPDKIPLSGQDIALIAAIGGAFLIGSLLQQIGLLATSVTNAGFLTTLYVVMVPIGAWLLFARRPEALVGLAAVMSVVGVWLIGDGRLEALTWGDAAVIAGAVFWALHVILIGIAVMRIRRTFLIVFSQYAVTAVGALLLAFAVETPTLASAWAAGPELLYAGIVSGGIAFTLQAVAQRYTPAADAAVILGSESLFAAVAGVVMLGERLSAMAVTGCAVIFLAMLLVELTPYLRRRLSRAHP